MVAPLLVLVKHSRPQRLGGVAAERVAARGCRQGSFVQISPPAKTAQPRNTRSQMHRPKIEQRKLAENNSRDNVAKIVGDAGEISWSGMRVKYVCQGRFGSGWAGQVEASMKRWFTSTFVPSISPPVNNFHLGEAHTHRCMRACMHTHMYTFMHTHTYRGRSRLFGSLTKSSTMSRCKHTRRQTDRLTD